MQNFAEISKNQLDSFLDLEKPEKMRLWLQNFVSIQPRTSLEKSDVSWPTVPTRNDPASVSSTTETFSPSPLSAVDGASATESTGYFLENQS